MNSKSTWIWIGVATALAAVIFGLEKMSVKPVVAPVPLLTDFKAAGVTNVQVTLVDQSAIRAELSNGVWQLTSPIVYPAQAASIEGLLAILEHLTPATIIPPNEVRQRPNGDEEFGFVNPQATLTLHTRNGLRLLKIGARTAPGDQVYVQVVGVEGVYVMDADLLRALPRKLDDWRDTGLINLSGLGFDQLTVSNAATVLELQRDPALALWQLTRPVPARANNPRLRDSLQKLHALRVTRFVTDDPKADAAAYGLQTPALELTLAKDTNVLARLQFGKSPTNDSTQVFARRLGLNAIVTVPRSLLDPWQGTFNQFREPHLVALPTNVAQIEIRGAEPFILQRNAGNGWRIVGQELPVDAALVDGLIAALNRLEIVQFKDSITEPDLATYGLTQPVGQIIVSAAATNATGATNIVLAALAFGATNAGNIFVRRADESPVYAVAWADFKNLPAAAWQLRARSLWDFAVGDVTRIVVQQGDHRREMLHAGTNTWVLAPGSSGVLDGVRMTAIEETTHRFGKLAATAWAGRGETNRARFGFGTNALALTFELKTGAKYQVEFGGMAPENYPYAAVKLDGETWFFEASLALYQLALYSLALPANVP